MPNSSQHSPPYTLAELADWLGAELHGDGGARVERVTEPQDARGPADLAIAVRSSRVAELAGSRARLAVLAAGMAPPQPLQGYIQVTQPRYALVRLLRLFEPVRPLPSGIHPSAVVDPSARIASSAYVGPLCYVAADVVVDDGVIVMSQVTVGEGSRIGRESVIHPGVRIAEGSTIGCRAVIHSNVCIGSAGFSFATPERGSVDAARTEKKVTATNRGIERIPSLGGVVIGDDVEIGAGSTIDRGTIGDTVIRRGTKIDNQVMVAHNCVIGEDCLIAGQSGIAGSCRVGDRVVMGGQVGVADNLKIGDDAVLAATSGVGYDVPARAVMIDTPAIPYKDFTLRYRAVARVHRLLKDLQELRQRVLRLERER